MYSFFLVGFGFGGYLGALPELDVRSAVDPDFRGSANVVLKNQAKKKSFDQHSNLEYFSAHWLGFRRSAQRATLRPAEL